MKKNIKKVQIEEIEAIVERMDFVCRAVGETRNSVLVNSGAGKNYIINLKNQTATTEKLCKIAEYTGTTVDFLIGKSSVAFPRKNLNTVNSSLANASAKLNQRANEILLTFATFLTTQSEMLDENKAAEPAESLYRAAFSKEHTPAEKLQSSTIAEKLESAEETDEAL